MQGQKQIQEASERGCSFDKIFMTREWYQTQETNGGRKMVAVVASQIKGRSFNEKDFEHLTLDWWSHAQERDIFVVSSGVMRYISDVKAPPGILATLRLEENVGPLPCDRQVKVVLLDRVSDPGNLGAIVRTALATGTSVVASEGSAMAFSPKAVRASAGNTLQLHQNGRLWVDVSGSRVSEWLRRCIRNGIPVFEAGPVQGLFPLKLDHLLLLIAASSR